MNILFISDVFFPRVNGVSTSINTFATELKALGHQVTLIAPSYGDDDKKEDSEDVLDSGIIIKRTPDGKLIDSWRYKDAKIEYVIGGKFIRISYPKQDPEVKKMPTIMIDAANTSLIMFEDAPNEVYDEPGIEKHFDGETQVALKNYFH